jgi:hypothetical protein
MKSTQAFAAVVILAAVPATALPKEAGTSQATVTLRPVRGSTDSGMAVLTQNGDKLTITITMKQHTGKKMQESGQAMIRRTSQDAHIHRGACPSPEKRPIYRLNPVIDGTSTTTLTNTSLSKLTSKDYTISVHRGLHDPLHPVACGDIKLQNPTGTSQ